MGKNVARIWIAASLAAAFALPAVARQQSDTAEPVVIVPYSGASDATSAPRDGNMTVPSDIVPIDFDNGSKESVETRLLDADSPSWLGGVETGRLSVEPFVLTPPPQNPGLAGR